MVVVGEKLWLLLVGLVALPSFLAVHHGSNNQNGMFKLMNERWQLNKVSTDQRNYGVAVSDVDGDGDLEFIVAGYTGPNLVLKLVEENGRKRLMNIATVGSPYAALRDEGGQAIGVCACDIDGDGREEIYFLNVDRYAGQSSYGDKLFKYRNNQYVDLFSDELNRKLPVKNFAGRSVACLDRLGKGKYGIILATYSAQGTGRFSLIEMNETDSRNDVSGGNIVLVDVSTEAKIDRSTGGRGIVVGPIVSEGAKSDIFFDNEGSYYFSNSGKNYLFKNLGNGSFEDVAEQMGIQDGYENGRGVALSDFDRDGKLDIVYGNWMGRHRLYLQKSQNGRRYFQDVATPEFSEPSPIRTVIAQDFDNDGHTEVLFNNIVYRSGTTGNPNKLFTVRSNGPGATPTITKKDIGDALEPHGFGTGGAVTDLDGDGHLELLLAHGESNSQPLNVYKVRHGRHNNWIRVQPMTKYGSFARGALVSVTTNTGAQQTNVIDGGSGYLCQMEPVAHFGFGTQTVNRIRVQWPDGKFKFILNPSMNKLHIVQHPEH